MYIALSGVTSRNKFKILSTKDSVYTEHKKYKADFLGNNISEIPNFIRKTVYEEIFYKN